MAALARRVMATPAPPRHGSGRASCRGSGRAYYVMAALVAAIHEFQIPHEVVDGRPAPAM